MGFRHELRRINRDAARRLPQMSDGGEVAELVHRPLVMPIRPSSRSGQQRINAKRNARAEYWARQAQPVPDWMVEGCRGRTAVDEQRQYQDVINQLEEDGAYRAATMSLDTAISTSMAAEIGRRTTLRDIGGLGGGL